MILTLKMLATYLGVGLPGLIIAIEHKPDLLLVISFFCYITITSIFMGVTFGQVIERIDENKKLIIRQSLYPVLAFIFIYCLIAIILEKHGGLNTLWARDRGYRLELYLGFLPPLTKYYILFSSTLLYFSIGILVRVSFTINLFIVSICVCYLADTLTESRSSALAFLVGVAMMHFIYTKFEIRSVIISLVIFLFTIPFLFIGQEALEQGALELRVFSYLAAPFLLPTEVYSVNTSPITTSVAEFFLWPVETVLGQLFDTHHEHAFYLVGNDGHYMNVLIPAYSVTYSILDTAAYLVASMAVLGLVIYFGTKSGTGLTTADFILCFGTFGPVSLMINPFLAEKSYWLFILVYLWFRWRQGNERTLI